MHLAFDAKRAFHNKAGLGNYSRNLLYALMDYYPEIQFSLFTPAEGTLFKFPAAIKGKVVSPEGAWRKLPSAWRSLGSTRNLRILKPDLYHGLSHELPFGIKTTGIKSVVTIHDLIFERFPEWYAPTDRMLYRLKYRSACRAANRIIAIGEQTANDLQEFWKVDRERIDIVHQSCHPNFWKKLSETEKNRISLQHKLPKEFMLQVGTLEPRKNQLASLQALLTDKTGLPLVLVGKVTPYRNILNRFIARHNLESRVHFFSEVPSEHLPAFYQLASLTLYPSYFEGFGIPVLESIVSGTPVITSDNPCFTDAGGKGALYVSPYRPGQLASAISQLAGDSELYQHLIQEGALHAEHHTPEKFARNTMRIYLKTVELK